MSLYKVFCEIRNIESESSDWFKKLQSDLSTHLTRITQTDSKPGMGKRDYLNFVCSAFNFKFFIKVV